MVRLKDIDHLINRYFEQNFNSNMVRLKVYLSIFVNTTLINFNSNMVRLKGDVACLATLLPLKISIPIWFD